MRTRHGLRLPLSGVRRVLFLFVVPACLASSAPDLVGLAKEAGGVAGVSAIHVESGRRFALNESLRFPMASVCKLPLAIETLHRVGQGKESLDRMVRLEPGDMRLGPLSNTARPGASYSIRQLLEASLQLSDNTATDVLFRLAGGPKAVETRMRALGVDGIDLSRYELEISADYSGVRLPQSPLTLPRLKRLYSAVAPEEARQARRRFEADLRDTATPAALAALLLKLQKGEALNAGGTATLLGMMQGCKTGDNRIRALLPPGTPVADKTGTIGGSVNDVGIVTLPGNGGHLVVAVMVREAKGPASAERAIARMARALYDAAGSR